MGSDFFFFTEVSMTPDQIDFNDFILDRSTESWLIVAIIKRMWKDCLNGKRKVLILICINRLTWSIKRSNKLTTDLVGLF